MDSPSSAAGCRRPFWRLDRVSRLFRAEAALARSPGSDSRAVASSVCGGFCSPSVGVTSLPRLPSSFDFEPTADVDITNSLWVESGDSCSRYLRFHANQSTIDRIIAAGRVRPDRSAVSFGKANDPGWWRPSRGPKTKVYTYDMYFRTERTESGSQDEILIYNPSTREAYYRYLSTE